MVDYHNAYSTVSDEVNNDDETLDLVDVFSNITSGNVVESNDLLFGEQTTREPIMVAAY